MSPLLSLSLLLSPFTAVAQAPDEDVDVVDDSDEDVVVADEGDEDVVVADEGDEDVVVEDAPPQPADDAPPSDAPPADVPGRSAESAPTDEELEFEGPAPNRPPPAGQGVVWGQLTDTKYHEPVIEAQVKVEGRKVEVFTDFDGYYRLELPPGTYDLRIFYELHEPLQLNGVQVIAGEAYRVDAELTPQEGAVEEMIIEDEAETQTVEGLALARQRSASTGDAIGRAEISKTTDSNAAEAAQRVVGANIVGGRFVYVRGLGERYSNSLLSGAPLPSPEPDRAAVPLNVFPALVLDSITIAKTFTPDIPGDFAGGSVQVETRSVPNEFIFKVSASVGYNFQSTFKDRLTHPGSGTDWLGFDSGLRSIPSDVPTDYPASVGFQKPDGSRVSAEELIGPGRSINTRMSPTTSTTLPNHGFSAVVGDHWTFGNGQKLGVLASLNYSRKFEIIEDEIRRDYWPAADDPRGYEERNDFVVTRGIDQIRWGAFGKVSYLPDNDHKVSLTVLHSQLADDETNFFKGFDQNIQGELANTQFVWVERGLTHGMLSGEHIFEGLNRAQLDWDGWVARAFRNEPDRRDTVYQLNERLPGWVYVDGTSSGRHFWSEQRENSIGGKIDWTQPLFGDEGEVTSVKFGGLVNVKERDFTARRFSFRRNTSAPDRDPLICEGEVYSFDCPDELFVNENIDTYIRLQENTQDTDAYDAHLNVYATYAMADVAAGPDLRVVLGPRIEWTDQGITPKNQFGGESNVAGADLNSTNVLPAVSAVYSSTKKTKTRLAVSRTLARPQLRELAPFAFADYFGGRVVAGNPDLELTRISNADMRFEYFPTLREVLAFSIFYKHFQDPIEEVVVPTGSTNVVTYRNADRANLLGFELEVRKNLGDLSEVLLPFAVVTNFTGTWSRTEVNQTGDNQFITNPSRSLVNQSPWVFNLALDYESSFGTRARALYNVSGKTLVQVGTNRLPDGYLQPRHMLDLTASQAFAQNWEVKVSAENVFNAARTVTLGKEERDDNIVSKFKTGTIVSLGLSYEM